MANIDQHEANIDYHIRRYLEELFEEDSTLNQLRVENQPTSETGIADLCVYRDLDIFIIFEDKKHDADADDIKVHKRAREYALELNSQFFVVSNIHHTYLYKFGTGSLSNNRLKFWNYGTLTNFKVILKELIEISLGRKNSEKNWYNFLQVYNNTMKNLGNELKSIIIEPDFSVNELKIFRENEKNIVQSFGMDYDTDQIEIREKYYDLLGSQSAYIILNKIFCYQLIKFHLNRYSGRIFNLPDVFNPSNPAQLKDQINKAFEHMIHRVDYAPIFKEDEYFSKIPFNNNINGLLTNFIQNINDNNLFEDLEEDFVSDMYSALIPISEKKKLGQVYTPYQIAKTMVYLIVDSKSETVLDPACGSGTFLREIYKRLEELYIASGDRKNLHSKILSQIWGNEINQFPAQLSMINLALMKIKQITELVGIVVNDFFKLSPLLQWMVKSLDLRTGDPISHILPQKFDLIIGNPPYIRQEQINNIDLIKKNILNYANHRTIEKQITRSKRLIKKKYKNVDLNARSDIYAYFIWYSTFFLKNHGKLCFIISNKWLDVNYGEKIKTFILKHYKITAIIGFGNNVFQDADVSTVILLLEREINPEFRKNNLIRFLHITKTISKEELRELAKGPIAIEKLNNIDNEDVWIPHPLTKRTIVMQHRLNIEEKWSYRFILQSKMLRKLRKKRNKLRMGFSSNLIEISGGLRTGAASFFFLKQSNIGEYGIPEKFLIPAIKQGRSLPKDKILISTTPNMFLLLPEDLDLSKHDGIKNWIDLGINRNHFNERNYNWKTWYAVPKKKIPFFDIVIKRHINVEFHPYTFPDDKPVIVSDGMQGIRIISTEKRERIKKFLLGVLSSTYFYWQAQVSGRWEGAGDLQVLVYELKNIEIPDFFHIEKKNPNKIDKIIKTFEIFRDQFERTPSNIENVLEAKKDLDLAVLDSLNLKNEYKLLISENEELELMRTRQVNTKILNY